MLILIEVSTLEMWPDYMYKSVDAVGIGHAPEVDYNPYASLFYVSFIFVITFFIMNLYVGGVTKKFNDIKSELDGTFFLTKD